MLFILVKFITINDTSFNFSFLSYNSWSLSFTQCFFRKMYNTSLFYKDFTILNLTLDLLLLGDYFYRPSCLKGHSLCRLHYRNSLSFLRSNRSQVFHSPSLTVSYSNLSFHIRPDTLLKHPVPF